MYAGTWDKRWLEKESCCKGKKCFIVWSCKDSEGDEILPFKIKTTVQVGWLVLSCLSTHFSKRTLQFREKHWLQSKKVQHCGFIFWWVEHIFYKTEAVARRCSVKKVLFEISQNSQENTCARNKVAGPGLQLY